MDTELSNLAGVWSLKCATATMPDGSVLHPFGTEPTGILVYTSDSWMSVLITSTSSAAEEARPVSYAGQVVTRPGELVHLVTVGTQPYGPGTEQVRRARFEGPDQLVLTRLAIEASEPVFELTWRREPSARMSAVR
jgi:hypothetical protein